MPDADSSSSTTAPRAGRRPAAGPAGSAAGTAGRLPELVTAEELAPFGRRVGALAVDWAIAMAIGYGFFAGDAFAILGVFAAQRVIVGGLVGSSIGHRLTGLRLVTVDRRRASVVLVLVRTVLLCLVLPGVWRTVAGVPLHDELARTRLVRVR